jgi:DNA repair photolyase
MTTNRRTRFVPYRPKTVLNKQKRADHWFWARYSAYPYVGCQHGCAFCYCREEKYYPYDDVNDFSSIIKVKENAPELLRRALSRVPVEVVFTGDYQPAERKFSLSRQMLEVCHDLGFPVFILERSPLVLRDLDLLDSINQRTKAVVAFSIIAAPDTPEHERVCQLERLAPKAEKRFEAMSQFAQAGIMTGTCFMPVLPVLCDTETNLASIVRWTAEHGGSFVLAGGLTLADQQRDYFFSVLAKTHPDLYEPYRQLYPVNSYGPSWERWRGTAQRVRELCEKHGILDRIPRPIIPGHKRELNKRIVEALASQLYYMELDGAPQHRVWAYRKAAWAIEDLEQDIGLVYRLMGRKGLESIPNMGPRLGQTVERLMQELA